ncbi:MAG: YraN family protein [Synechococcaceae cyanobacterium SM2_3_1]|nr:YraN family protein [Synechococcaceae cyanobacterium SM2_3_1]
MPKRTQQQQVGDGGENFVGNYLRQQGWQILSQQWHCRWGELDLVARKGSVLAFVEVKTRRSGNWDETGLLAVHGDKQKKIIKTALIYLSQQQPSLAADLEYRFDVALVQHSISPKGDLIWQLEQYIPAAFELSQGGLY